MPTMKIQFSLLVCGFFSALYAQPVPKYLLLEHFTNSRCSVCASKNPGFYNTIANYADEVHHIAYHPPVPYNNCVFYLHNPDENEARADAYGILGTPTVYLNGNLIPIAAQLITAGQLEAQIGQTSPLEIRVTESGDAERTVTVRVRTAAEESLPGALRLYAAVVEKVIGYESPNGEEAHYDVFRRMLPDIDGAPFFPAAPGNEVEVSYTFSIDAAWQSNEIYVVAFVQSETTGEVINSGTRFDQSTAIAALPQDSAVLPIYPNPSHGECYADLSGFGDGMKAICIRDLSGQILFTVQTDAARFRIQTQAFPGGLYFVEVRSPKGTAVGKLAVE